MITPWDIAAKGWIACVAVVSWVGQQHIRATSKRFDEVFDRLHQLETDRATKSDVARIETRLDALGAELNEGQRRILEILARRKSDVLT